MVPRRNAKFILDIFASKISLLMLGLLTAWLGYSVAKEEYRKHQVAKEIEALKQEILELERENSGLSSLLDSFGDPKNVELEAKRRLNLKSPGEEVAVILRDKNEESQNIVKAGREGSNNEFDPVTRPGEGPGDPPTPLKWWKYIAGRN